MKKDVIVVVGAGSIGQATARRVGAGKQVLLASLREQDAATAERHLKTPDSRSARPVWTSRHGTRCRHSSRPPRAWATSAD